MVTVELRKEISAIKKSKFKNCKKAVLTSNELLIMMEECKWIYCHSDALGISTLMSKEIVVNAIRATLNDEYQVEIENTRSSLKSIWIG